MQRYEWEIVKKNGYGGEIIGKDIKSVEIKEIIICNNGYLSEEQETTINIERDSDLIHCFTSDGTMITKILNKKYQGAQYNLLRAEKFQNRLVNLTWTMPKNKLSFRS